jgi:hypothetical protein
VSGLVLTEEERAFLSVDEDDIRIEEFTGY